MAGSSGGSFLSNANTKLSSHPQPAVSTKDVLVKMRKVKMLNVGSKVIAITGASSGIGEATAGLLAHKGFTACEHGAPIDSKRSHPKSALKVA